MGIGFVLLVWTVVGVVVACIGSVLLGRAAAFLTRGADSQRKKIIVAARAFPFACLGWAAVVFTFQAVVNTTLLHRDPGLGDSWNCPLPNGYALLMIDVPDEGVIYNAQKETIDGSVGNEGPLGHVREMQIAGPYILGGSSRASVTQSEADDNQIVDYFLLDTRTGTETTLSTYSALRAEVQQLGINLNFQSIYSVYSKYRFTWFDLLAALTLFLPALIFAVLLVRSAIKLRRTRLVASPSAS